MGIGIAKKVVRASIKPNPLHHQKRGSSVRKAWLRGVEGTCLGDGQVVQENHNDHETPLIEGEVDLAGHPVPNRGRKISDSRGNLIARQSGGLRFSELYAKAKK